MKQQEMVKKQIFIKLHSVLDLITNSSSELFIVDTSKAEEIVKEILFFFAKESKSCSEETSIECLVDRPSYKTDYIIPEDIDEKDIYICNIDQNNDLLVRFIEKFFTVIELKYRD